MSIREQRNLNELKALLTNTAGRNAEASMLFVTTQQADKLIVDFGEQEQANIIPIMPEYEDKLEAADYDAYCNVVNWPKQLIFRSRMEPQDPTPINTLESDSSSTSETE